MATTWATMCNEIAAVMATVPGVVRVQSYNQLTEGMNDYPTIQVYPEQGATDTATSTDRTTFKAGVRQTQIVFHIDVYARQRSQLDEDMAAVVTLWDAVQDKLEDQVCNRFGDEKAFKNIAWTAQRVEFTYTEASPPVRYPGIRFVLTVRVF